MPSGVLGIHTRNWVLTALVVVVAATFGKLTNATGWFVTLYSFLFIGWIWLPTHYKTLRNTLIFTGVGVLGILLAASMPFSRELALTLFLPYAGPLGRQGNKAPWPFLAVLGLAALRIAIAPGTIYEALSYGLAILGIYWAVYSVHIRREAQQRDRDRVQQLEAAYRELQETHRQLAEASQQVAEARARDARLETLADIHDGVGHQLTSLIVGLESLELMVPEEPQKAAVLLPELVEAARNALKEVRQALQAHSDGMADYDIYSLIHQASRRGSLQTTLDFDVHPDDLSRDLRATLYRVIRELMTNILRHAHAHHVDVRLRTEPERIVLTVSDDGSVTTNIEPGFGLSSIQRRLEFMDGRFQFSPNPPQGLTVEVTLPRLPEGEAADDSRVLG